MFSCSFFSHIFPADFSRLNLLLVCAWPQVQNLLSASWTNNPFRRNGRNMRECSMTTRNTIVETHIKSLLFRTTDISR